ncbi:hypothetical protein B0H10DRAFT_2102971 [Mycena sp. CBHHK59/15]|nr:hypothetical protein B0H10DRAFT_2102971 [Mycena sp. CBHHK59/15]
MVCLARPTIEFQQIDKQRPPSALPLGMLEMLAASLQVSNTPLKFLAHPLVSPTDDEIMQRNKAALSHDDIMTLMEPLTRPLCCMSNKRSKDCVLHLFGQYLQM